MRRALAFVSFVPLAACAWNPARPFDRDAPAVDKAISALGAGDASAAASALEDYLSTGPCKDGSIGTPDLLKRRADGTFDLGLSLFEIGEQFGGRFGEEEGQGQGHTEAGRAKRHAQVVCARQILQAILEGHAASGELRARAFYLDGNLSFLDGEYEEAVREYDEALFLIPGVPDGGDPVGRDAAWNRALALRRIEDKKDAGNDASKDNSSDSGPKDGGGGNDGADAAQGGPDASKGGGSDAAPDDALPDAAPPAPAPAPEQDAGDSQHEAGSLGRSEDERMLDQFEQAPTLQQEEARRARKKPVRGMVDK